MNDICCSETIYDKNCFDIRIGKLKMEGHGFDIHFNNRPMVYVRHGSELVPYCDAVSIRKELL